MSGVGVGVVVVEVRGRGPGGGLDSRQGPRLVLTSQNASRENAVAWRVCVRACVVK